MTNTPSIGSIKISVADYDETNDEKHTEKYQLKTNCKLTATSNYFTLMELPPQEEHDV